MCTHTDLCRKGGGGGGVVLNSTMYSVPVTIIIARIFPKVYYSW